MCGSQLSLHMKPNFPFGFRVFSGSINCRIASKTILNCESYFFSGLSNLLVGMGSQHLPQPDKRSHNLDIHGHGPRAPKDAGEHGYPLLGEGVRAVLGVLASLSGHRL